MISGMRGQLIDLQVDPNLPDDRFPSSFLASNPPQWMMIQNGRGSAELVSPPDYRNMLVLSSRSSLPRPFPTSFTTGTTLPPPADSSQLTGGRYGSSSPLQTAFMGEHVVL